MTPEEKLKLAITKKKNRSLAEMWCKTHDIPTDFLTNNEDGSVTFSFTFK